MAKSDLDRAFDDLIAAQAALLRDDASAALGFVGTAIERMPLTGPDSEPTDPADPFSAIARELRRWIADLKDSTNGLSGPTREDVTAAFSIVAALIERRMPGRRP